MARRQARKIHDVPQCCGNRGPREEKPGIAPGITKPKAYQPGHHNAGGCTCIIRASLANRVIVLFAAMLLTVSGVLSVFRTPLAALPDLSDTHVIIPTQ